MYQPNRIASLLAVGVLLALPSMSAAESAGVKEIHGISRSTVTLRLAEIGPPADRPGGGGGGGGGKPGGGGLPGSTWHEANASLAMTNATYSGLPVNEPFIAASATGSTLIAGANDYRSGNGQGQAAFYRSTDGGLTWSGSFLNKSTTWDDSSSHGSGDPWLAFGTGGRAYYSAIYFDFNTNCDGGIYVAAGDSGGLASADATPVSLNGPSFEDKAAMAVLPGGGDGSSDTVVVTWTRFFENSCTDTTYHDSKLYMAVSTNGGTSFGTPAEIPTLTPYNQGSFPVFDTTGDLYVAYENWANASDLNGRIAVTRIPAGGGAAQVTLVSPITDLLSPLPGTKFRTNSFPTAAIAGGQLAVAWASETGSGNSQIQLASQPLGDISTAGWTTPLRVDADPTGVTTALSVSASDRFFAAIAGHGTDLGLVWLDRRDDGSNKKYRAWGAFYTWNGTTWAGGTNVPIASTLSDTSKDPFFRGQFIGDYIGATYDAAGNFHPVWTDMRSKAPLPYRGQTQEIWTAYYP